MAFRATPNNPRAKHSDSEFIKRFETIGPAKMAQRGDGNISSIYKRRNNLEKLYRKQIVAPSGRGGARTRVGAAHPARLHFDVLNGTVLIGSDAHIWPGPLTTAMRAFIKFSKDLNPRAVILNGDVCDLPKVSRHDPLGWEDQPTVADEIEATQAILARIEDAVPRNAKLAWTLGNHDARFEARLADVAHEYAKIHGFHLKDHFGARWQPCYATWINDTTVVKHRISGGSGALRNNVLKTGKHTITGHLHAQHVWPVTDYNGTLFGVDSGCLADPGAEAFVHYTEDNPLDWRSGFVVLEYRDGKLLPPDLVHVWDKNHVVFRGELITV